MKDYFLHCLINKWDNKAQAKTNPTEYSHVHYDWDIEDDVIKSRQWYDYNGEVYRERTHSIDVTKDSILLNIDQSGIVVEFKPAQHHIGYIGKTPEDTFTKDGVKVHTTITLDPYTFTSADQGICPEGEVVWGDTPGPFVFKPTE
jgi:hypothetical protein